MSESRLIALGGAVWAEVFAMLDAEADFDGESAGMVAGAAERAVIDELRRVLGIPEPGRSRRRVQDGSDQLRLFDPRTQPDLFGG